MIIGTPKRNIIISRVDCIDQLKTIIMNNQYPSCIQNSHILKSYIVSLSLIPQQIIHVL